jgi:uncharacterized membrane protein affecting hemolysin expression
MDKAIQTNVITAVVTAAIMGILAWGAGVFKAGSDALDEVQIEAVITRVLVMDSGQTFAQTLNSLNNTTIALNTTVKELTKEVDDLEVAVLALAAE